MNVKIFGNLFEFLQTFIIIFYFNHTQLTYLLFQLKNIEQLAKRCVLSNRLSLALLLVSASLQNLHGQPRLRFPLSWHLINCPTKNDLRSGISLICLSIKISFLIHTTPKHALAAFSCWRDRTEPSMLFPACSSCRSCHTESVIGQAHTRDESIIGSGMEKTRQSKSAA